MKKIISHIPVMLLLLLGSSDAASATHLDGLWRNDRLNITLRIESLAEGFRAKRMDLGIWHMYLPDRDDFYTDRYGNHYQIIDTDKILWQEARSDKRIMFARVNDRDAYRWDGYRNDDWHRERYDERYDDHPVHINGIWRGHDHQPVLEVMRFKCGLRVKRSHGGWEKYYPDRDGFGYRDRYGNTIQILDRNLIRWTGAHGRRQHIYHREP